MSAGTLDTPGATLADIGEKTLIAQFVRPLFNPSRDPWGVGDDCALTPLPMGHSLLASTDRVPADLISFKAGVLDHAGLGGYLVRLNLSDIAACGGFPRGLLLNFGLPRSLPLASFVALLEGVQLQASALGCPVLGGDLSDAAELSLSATALGSVEPQRALSRSGARPGDTIFVSRPIGVTPAAFRYLKQPDELGPKLSAEAIGTLRAQFSLEPMLELGQALAASGRCSACMDNTDGLSQTLHELATASCIRISVDSGELEIPPLVRRVAAACSEDAFELALSAGADFSLVGALIGYWTTEAMTAAFGPSIRRIGVTEKGEGVFLNRQGDQTPIKASGWSYYG